MTNPFTEDYYLRGKEKGLSNYENYEWKPDLTIAMATQLKRYLKLEDGDDLLDVGAARGYLVKAMRMIGIEAFGYDISQWAVENCHPDVRPFMTNYLPFSKVKAIISKDCMEHIAPEVLAPLLEHFLKHCAGKMFIIVPLASESGGKYVHPKEENDKTHVNRWTLIDWMLFLQARSPSFIVNASFRIPGLKPGCYEVDGGYGFFTLERI